MPKNDSRNAHRYSLSRVKIQVGWWERHQFRTISARLRDLSLSGALIELEEGAACPSGVKTWICLADQSPARWVQAERKDVDLDSAPPGTPSMLRLKFVDAFPYESFKTAVWDDGSVERKSKSGADANLSPCGAEGSVQATKQASTTEQERIRFFLQLDAPAAAWSGGQPEIAAASPPPPPTLVEAHRSQMAAAGATASFPWMAVLLISLFISVLLGLLSWAKLINLRQLAIFLGSTGSA
jgi:hypothetical protein